MPVMNGERFIEEALRCALASEVDLEIIVQDGGSTDATAEIVASLGDRRVSFLSESDQGQADALNRAIRRARGRWILWLNADDFVDPSAVSRLSSTLMNTEATLVYGDFAIVDVAGRPIRSYECPGHWSRGSLLDTGLRVFSGSIFLDRTLLCSLGGFDNRLHYCMDYELLIRIIPEARLLYVPGVIGSFRMHSGSKSGSVPWRFFREYRSIQSKYRSSGLWGRVKSYNAQSRLALFTATSRFRYSRTWSRIRPTKRFS